MPEDAAALRTQVASLQAVNESLRALLEDKDAKITELEAELACLKRLISRNSGSSSMPPSGDDQPGKTPPEQKPGRGGSKRKPGKQPGAYLAWNDHPRVPGGKKVKQPPARLLLECLRDREADVLRFLTDTAIPPASSQAERDLRPAKTQQEISGRLRSETTTRHRYASRGYASTARKHGIDVFTAIKDALARRKPLDTAHPRQRLNCTRNQSRTAIQP